ncbi:hypothetical protein AB9K34_13385 [Sedimentitalea sp. XS_ASV28]|uniref:hypothetical protein n=1 Tax=Sedimentitalea sp. XS_ASV28 TaxID=3241296 RepID=UPI003516D95B
MIRWLASLLLIPVCPVVALAQDPELRVELASDTVVVGQPLELRIRVLVPTWMPKPPGFPTLEIPSLMVHEPERASNPASDRVDGETWYGIERTYQLYPLAAGDYVLPTGNVAITYADPDSTDPVAYSAPLPDIRFVATIPAAAAKLSPPVLARGFTLTQEIDGTAEMTVGDAITRRVTARIEGTTPVLIPRLAVSSGGTALRAYPRDPVVSESDERGILSGTRTEVTTYVAQGDGTQVLPAIAIDWFNLETGAIETASVPEIPLSVTGAPAPPPDPGEIAKWLALAGVLLIAGLGLFRRFRPALIQRYEALRQDWQNSERYAHRAVHRAIARRDLSAAMTALDRWKSVAHAATEQDFTPLNSALAALGAARFGRGERRDDTDAWRHLSAAYAAARRRWHAVRRHVPDDEALPPLNP